MAFNLNNIFGIKKAIKYLLKQTSKQQSQIDSLSGGGSVDSYEYVAYYNVSGTTLSLDTVVKNTLTDLNASAVVNAFRNSVGRYTLAISDIGDVSTSSSVVVQTANAFDAGVPRAFPQFTGGSGTQVVIEFKDDSNVAEEVNGKFLVMFKIYI